MDFEPEQIPVLEEQSLVSNESFAEQIRNERLDIVWKSTLVVATILLWVFIARNGIEGEGFGFNAFVPWASVVLACVLCRVLLRMGRTTAATWAYALGVVVSTGAMLYGAEGRNQDIVPFFTLVSVYVVGLMLPPRAMPPFLVLNTSMILGVMWFRNGELNFPSNAHLAAIGLSFVTALLSVQASGELYAIAEWALENYRRERDSAGRLYESRQKVERSLLRQQALTKELGEANDQLGQARQAAEEAKHFRGQFLANMSHELRTPLNAVIGFSETMLNFPPMYNMVELPPEYRQDLNQIHNSGKHLLSIINDILDLSKIDAGRLDLAIQRVELEPILKGVMSTAVGLVGGKPIKLTRETPDVLPDVSGDPVRIRQVLLNLYSNAAKFTESGYIKLCLTQDKNEVIISVEDTGEGIHPDDLRHVFEEFRQGSAGRKKARAGAGLGLAISRQLLDLMGGNVWAESTLGEGSTFYFTLPIYDDVKAIESEKSVAQV